MLKGLWLDWKLRRLRTAKRKARRFYAKKIQTATASKDSGRDVNGLRYDEYAQMTVIDDEVAGLVTDRLVFLAQKNLIPLPPPDPAAGAWVESVVTGCRHLTAATAMELRATIRKEQRERSELLFRWLAALTGIIGALIGLTSLVISFFRASK